MSILVIAEHDHNNLKSATLNTITAAQKCGSDIHVLVAGHNAGGAVAAAQKCAGVAKVLHADSQQFAHFLPENLAQTIADIAKNYAYILAPATSFGRNILPRVAGLLDVQQISDVVEIVSGDTFRRPVYAGNAILTVQSSDAIKLLTVRGTAFGACAQDGSASIETITPSSIPNRAEFVSQELTKSERPELTSAKIVVSGGRGVGSADNFKSIVETLADTMGAAVGASRAAVDSGYAPNDYQVGQTGKVVAPELYVAVGISGAIQHLAGMKDSKTIVAINKDPDAPIFAVADYGLVGDLHALVPELTQKLKG
jgi:electron transfer flavoprotein alpha subunit